MAWCILSSSFVSANIVFQAWAQVLPFCSRWFWLLCRLPKLYFLKLFLLGAIWGCVVVVWWAPFEHLKANSLHICTPRALAHDPASPRACCTGPQGSSCSTELSDLLYMSSGQIGRIEKREEPRGSQYIYIYIAPQYKAPHIKLYRRIYTRRPDIEPHKHLKI